MFLKSAFVVTKVTTSAVLSLQTPLGKDILARTRSHTYRITVLTLYLTLKKCISHMTQIFFQEFKKTSSWYFSLHHVLNISALYIAGGNLDVAMRRRFWEALRNVTCNVHAWLFCHRTFSSPVPDMTWQLLVARCRMGHRCQRNYQSLTPTAHKQPSCPHTNSLKTKATCTLGFICFRRRGECTPLLEQRWLLTQLENGQASQGHTPTHLKGFVYS